MTQDEAQAILNDPSTHRLVYEVLAAADRRDPVDVLYDLRLIVEIFEALHPPA